MYWILAGLLAVLCALGVTQVLGSAPIYACIVLLAFLQLLGRHGSRRVRWFEILLALVILIGGTLTAIGRLAFDQTANSFALFVPMLLVAGAVIRPPVLNTKNARVIRRLLILMSTLFAIGGLITVSQGHLVLGGAIDRTQFLHQNSYLLVPGALLAVTGRRWIALSIIGVASVSTYAAYPALTFILTASSILGCLIAAALGPRWRKFVLAAGLLLIGEIATHREAAERLTASYFVAVGKSDNSETRSELIDIGLRKVSEHPWLGDRLIQDISVTAPLSVVDSAPRIPLHNDFLQLAVAGGIPFAFIFFVGILGIGLTAFGSIDDPQSSDEFRHLGFAISGTILAALAICLFNPILVDIETSSVLSLLMVLHLSVKRT